MPSPARGLAAQVEIETVNLVSYFIAFGAGVISFLSPCVLPIVPGYLSVITGLDITDWPLAMDIGGTQRNGLYRSLGGTGGMSITGFYDADGSFLRVNIGEMTFTSATELMVELGMITPERAGLS